jgi:hypothetical protein
MNLRSCEHNKRAKVVIVRCVKRVNVGLTALPGWLEVAATPTERRPALACDEQIRR